MTLAIVLWGCSKSIEWQYEQVKWEKGASGMHIYIDRANGASHDNIDCHSTDELLKDMGERNWELVSVVPDQSGQTFYFKRPRPANSEGYAFTPQFDKGKTTK